MLMENRLPSVLRQKSTETQETMVQQYLTWWKEIGLNVELYTGRTIEYNTFYESIRANDEGLMSIFSLGLPA